MLLYWSSSNQILFKLSGRSHKWCCPTPNNPIIQHCLVNSTNCTVTVMQLLALKKINKKEAARRITPLLVPHCTNHVAAHAETEQSQARWERKRDGAALIRLLGLFKSLQWQINGCINWYDKDQWILLPISLSTVLQRREQEQQLNGWQGVSTNYSWIFSPYAF